MISLSLAMDLKNAGLIWKPALHDFFAIPQPGLDGRVFVVSDMTIDVVDHLGWETITFNGAVEWSLDYVVTAEVVWMPTEAQLREELQQRLLTETQPTVRLESFRGHYRCQIEDQGQVSEFAAAIAEDAYGQALLYLLQSDSSPGTGNQTLA